MKEKTQTQLLEDYYSKFKEENRLKTRHGQVEFLTALKYIKEFSHSGGALLDLGAGTGSYSSALVELGYKVTAVELTQCNCKKIRALHKPINLWQGDARDLHFLDDGVFDLVLVFGPLYHLHTREDKVKVLLEAKRVVKKTGLIMANYLMNEYAVITYCFRERHIIECEKSLTSDYHTITGGGGGEEGDLYSYVRLEDIDVLNKDSGLKSIKRVALDGAADYIRRELNALSEEEFQKFLDYHAATCERRELLGATSHLLDILALDGK